MAEPADVYRLNLKSTFPAVREEGRDTIIQAVMSSLRKIFVTNQKIFDFTQCTE